jgi:hypothetical protein
MFRSLGISYNEVVVALLDKPDSASNLLRFTRLLSFFVSSALLIVVATPLSAIWFEQLSGLSPHLANNAQRGLWIALPLPALSTLQSWYQGAILHGQRTRGITEAVIVYLLISTLVLGTGVIWVKVIGLYVGLGALTISVGFQTVWLWYRSKPALKILLDSDKGA